MSPTLQDSQAGLDLIEEIRLRTWARLHYAPEPQRDTDWHPIVLEEMRRRDREVSQ